MLKPLDQPKVAIIILNWDNADDTLACLRSVAALDYSPIYTVIVDNGSTNDSISRIRAEHPQITLIEIGENLGYAGGNNVGIYHALQQGVDYIWLLNDDIIVDPGSLTELAKVAEAYPDTGFVGPKVYIQNDPQRILTAGILLDEQFHSHHRGIGELDEGQYDKITEVDGLSGCSLLVSRKVIEEVGPLDENFFAYHEEIDWCYSAKKAAYKLLFVPQAKVWHPDTRSRDTNAPRVMYYMSRNRLLFLRKHGLGFWLILKSITQYIIWLINWTLNPKWRHIKEKRDALWWALKDFALGRFGKSNHV